MSGPIAVIKERPFSGQARVLPIGTPDEMPTLAGIAAGIDDVSREFFERCEARINGDLIERRNWHRVRPRYVPGLDTVVTFTMPLGGPGQNTGVMIASIAVLVIAAAVTGGAGAAFLPVLAAGTPATVLLSAGIAIGGSLAIAALAPPPSFGAAEIALTGGAKTGLDTKQAAALNGNVLAKGAPIPRVLGTHRVYPPWATPPLVEIVGKDQYVEAVGILSGPHALADLMVGQTLASTIVNLETEMVEGLPASPEITLVTRQSYTDTTAATNLSKHNVTEITGTDLVDQVTPLNSCPTWSSFSSRTAPDEIWIPISINGGLARPDGSTGFVPIRVRIRESGDTTWINLPEFHIVLKRATQFIGTIKLMWQADIARNTPDATGGIVRTYYLVDTQNIAPTGVGGWTANAHFKVAGDNYLASTNLGTTGLKNINVFGDRIEYYLSGATFPQSGSWEIQVIRGRAVQDNDFNISDYHFGGGASIVDFFTYRTTGTHKLGSDQRSFADEIVIPRVSSIWNETPIPDPTKFSAIAIKAKNQSVQDVTVLASAYTKDWDGSGWNTVTTTSNPAPHFYEVLTGDLGSEPMPAAIVDSAGLVIWRQHCIDMGYNANCVVEGKTYADVLTILAAAGYAKPSHNELWGVMVDKDRSADTPIQIFTPRNMSDFSWSRAFAKLPSGIRARFNDSTDFYKPAADVFIYADPLDEDVSRLEQISYDAYVTEAEVTARAAFDLLQIQHRLTFYKGKTDYESIVCTRGDLVGVQHDTLMSQAGFSRIKSVTTSGSNITGLVLDGSIPTVLGVTAGLVIRLKDGSGIITKQIGGAGATSDLTVITFTTPFANPGTSKIDVDCLVAVGPLGSEYKRLIVYGIIPDADGGADMIFVDEAPELWA